MNLEELFNQYGCDKNASKYTESYMSYFDPIKNNITSVLEIGIGTVSPNIQSTMLYWKNSYAQNYTPGGSLKAWRDFFTNANIHGVDIDPDTLFEEERIKTLLFNSQIGYECNKNLNNLTFDIIIDDGDHNPLSQIKTFFNLISRINPNGFYVIEDITPCNSDLILRFISPIIQLFGFKSNLINPEKNLLILEKL